MSWVSQNCGTTSELQDQKLASDKALSSGIESMGPHPILVL